MFLVRISVSALSSSDSSRRSRIPPATRKNRKRDSGPLRKRSPMHPAPRLPPRGLENHQKRFLRVLGTKKVPKSALRVTSSAKIFFFKSPRKKFFKIFFLFFIFLSDVSRKIGLGVLWNLFFRLLKPDLPDLSGPSDHFRGP